jgi:hypothetical protein
VPEASCFGERITTTPLMQRPLIGRAVPWCAHRSGTLLRSRSSGRVLYMEAENYVYCLRRSPATPRQGEQG